MENKNQTRAIFIDRDGTISEEVGYVNHPNRFWLLPQSSRAIRLMNQMGLKTIVITNQSGVARGYFPERMVLEIHQKMIDLLQQEGATIDKIYYCPHHPEVGPPEYRQDCNCRKPKLGMLLAAAEEFGLDLSHSYIIGDKYTEILLAHKALARSILVLTGYGQGEYELFQNKWECQPDFIAKDLLEAAEWIQLQEKHTCPQSGSKGNENFTPSPVAEGLGEGYFQKKNGE